MCILVLSLSAQKSVIDCEKGDTLPTIPAGYVDLGLPSGTLWKDKNEGDVLYTYDQAMAKFGNDLPTKEQLEELQTACEWTWNGSGYNLEGPSGASIVLPAAGFHDCHGSIQSIGLRGFYWSSTPDNSDRAWSLYLSSSSLYVFNLYHCGGQSVRLVR